MVAAWGTVYFAPIVEGHGDRAAIRTLIHRVGAEVAPQVPLEVLAPLRIPKHTLLRVGELERAVEYSARKLNERMGGVIVLIDADDDCPAELSEDLRQRARGTRSDVAVKVILAKCEFESWAIASAESLRGWKGLPDDLTAPADPEQIRGAKEWLTARMPRGVSYTPTVDQPGLAARLNIAAARASPSFDKFYRDVRAIIDEAFR